MLQNTYFFFYYFNSQQKLEVINTVVLYLCRNRQAETRVSSPKANVSTSRKNTVLPYKIAHLVHIAHTRLTNFKKITNNLPCLAHRVVMRAHAHYKGQFQ